MKITLSAREYNHLEAACDVLEKYSRMYSAMVLNETGMNHDTAGTAINMIKSILKESAPQEP